MKTINKLSLILLFGITQSALAQFAPVAMQKQRGFIDVFELRKAVSRLEALLPTIDEERCETRTCQVAVDREKKKFKKARSAFMRKWGSALLTAIDRGDEVAEVIWRQCNTTPIIERSALASTCDNDPARRKEAALRLRQIGFEAALDEEAEGNAPAWEPDRNKRRPLSQARTIRQMEAGVYGGWTIDNYNGGNAAQSPEELVDIQREAVIDAALTLVRRSFTYIRRQDGSDYESHAQLRLNRKPIGTHTLAWSANVFYSGKPYTGPYDPAWGGFEVYLRYAKGGKTVVGGNHDVYYLRMLYETLMRSEQRIDDWLKRDPRWSVFLLHRRGHHEWVPKGMKSPFGRLNPTWGGEWVLDKKFVNFMPVASHSPARLRIRVGDAQTIAQFEEAGTSSYACELRYSGGNSHRPENDNHAKTATNTALGYLPALAPISPHEAGPVQPFAPMNPHKIYRQVLVQCPQGEWPDNRNKRFLFLANDKMIEVHRAQGSRDLTIQHWQRKAPLVRNVRFNKLAPPFDLKPTLDRLAEEATTAEEADRKLAQVRAKVSSSDADELIASLTQLRLEKSFYSPSSDFPDNLTRLIDTPDISIKICAAYRENPPDALQRFNFMVVLNRRARNQLLTPKELTIVPDCLRLALNDRHAWVRLEAVDAIARFAEEKDRAKLMELQNDPDEDVRRYSQNALNRLKPLKQAN